MGKDELSKGNMDSGNTVVILECPALDVRLIGR